MLACHNPKNAPRLTFFFKTYLLSISHELRWVSLPLLMVGRIQSPTIFSQAGFIVGWFSELSLIGLVYSVPDQKDSEMKHELQTPISPEDNIDYNDTSLHQTTVESSYPGNFTDRGGLSVVYVNSAHTSEGAEDYNSLKDRRHLIFSWLNPFC